MIGRKDQIKVLKKTVAKKKSSFIAVTGRRRIGKTFLIDTFFKNNICFRLTGIQDASIEYQVQNFTYKLEEFTTTRLSKRPTNWMEAFSELKKYLQTLDKRSKKVIFIDELPWVATARSGFLQLLGHLWNDYLSKEKHFILVVCGSSTSWIINKIVNDTGGLHNRLSEVIRLKPFTLSETQLFLQSLNIRFTPQEISKLYMTLGGVPYYLEQVNMGDSAATAIERICFSEGGILKNEYENLYKALFKNAQNHEAIVTVLATSRAGLERKEIISKSKIKAGGQYDRTMTELVQSGFVSEFIPYGRKKRGVLFRLNDEYSIFYHRFIKPNKKYTPGMWNQLASGQAYKIWLGYAFENLCLKHIAEIKQTLGISGVYSENSSIRVEGTKQEKGFQIDLIIDRNDAIINICELKYYAGLLKIDKRYSLELIERRNRFIAVTKTKKQVYTTFITSLGIFENEYSNATVDVSIELDELF